MRRVLLFLLILLFAYQITYSQHGFPSEHWCASTEGWKSKRCRALGGLKSRDDDNKVITFPHRGFWGLNGIPEGTVQAMQAAYDKNYMFIEADLVLSKDKILVLMHDQQTNRVTSLPKTFSTDGGLNDNGSFIRSLNFNKTTNNSVPNEKGEIISSFPAMKDAYYLDRFGEKSSIKLQTFVDLAQWLQNKDAIIALDIKTGSMKNPTIRNEYLEAVKLCLQIAKEKRVLHKIIFKPGSSGQLTIKEFQDYLQPLGLWDIFSKQVSVVLINIVGESFPLATDKGYLDEWLSLPSLVGVEVIFKTADDPFLLPRPAFGNASVLQYIQFSGFRTGVFHPIPSNEYGAPGGRGNNFNPPNEIGKLDDFRGNMEFLFFGPPTNCKRAGMLVTDRPDVDMIMLEAFGLNSKYTKRDNDF